MGTTSSIAPRSPAVHHAPRTSEPVPPPRTTPPPRIGHSDVSTFERGPAARTEARARLEGVLERSGTDAALRSRVLGRIDRLPEAEQAREQALLERVASGPNGPRAVRAYDEISEIAGSSRRARERLTPELRESLVRGVAEPRTADRLGQEGILGVHQATTAARALVDMPQARYDRVRDSFARAGQSHAASPSADPQAERALMLDAVAARAPQLSRRGSAGDAALDEVTGFASEVRGLPREELIRTTSAIDLDGSRSTSSVRASDLGRAGTDTIGNNDGLVQRWTDSCGPTSAQIARAELDPVYARRLHREGVSATSTDGALAAEQRATLEAGHGVAVSREQRGRAMDALERIQGAVQGEPQAVRSRLGSYLRGEITDTTELAGVAVDLDRIRGRTGGRPSAEDLRLIREVRRQPAGEGMLADVALDRIAGGAAHSRYAVRDAGAHGVTSRQADDMARRLQAGDDVGIRICDSSGGSGHFLMMTDVRGEGADRQFLVSDPWSGRTDWVREQDLRTQGTHAFESQFGLGPQQDRVSTYYYPR